MDLKVNSILTSNQAPQNNWLLVERYDDQTKSGYVPFANIQEISAGEVIKV